MVTPHALLQAIRQLDMYLDSVDLPVAEGFIQGYDVATGGAALAGFREWLIVRRDGGNNLTWVELARRLALADTASTESPLLDPTADRTKVQFLGRVLELFWAEREARGLRTIYFRYQQWLRSQSWYTPSSADWIDE